MDTLNELPSAALSGVARVLVHGGRLTAKAAEELTLQAKDRKVSFVEALISSNTMTPGVLAHSLAHALSVPLLDLDAIDAQKSLAAF
ncbi:hypothetical protein [Ideonella paludis]